MVEIKKRNPVLVLVLSIVTFGIYGIYWFVKTKEEINSLGAQIPTAWLIIIPIANLYWYYKYAEGFAKYVKRDNNTIMYFLLIFFVGIVAMVVFQTELNKLADVHEQQAYQPQQGNYQQSQGNYQQSAYQQ